jgi:hypothetical protein
MGQGQASANLNSFSRTNKHRRGIRPAASRRCTPEISLRSCPIAAAASSTRFQRLPARQAPSQLIRPTRIAGRELADGKSLRSISGDSCRRTGRSTAGRTPRQCSLLPDGVASPQFESRCLMPAVGAYARPLARRSRKAAAAIRRVDSRPRVLVVRVSRALPAV